MLGETVLICKRLFITACIVDKQSLQHGKCHGGLEQTHTVPLQKITLSLTSRSLY